jgi:hypothetical protein
MRRCWDALSEAAAAQAKHQAQAEPTARFLALIRGLLVCGRAHIASSDGTVPDWSPQSCGWRGMTPQGDCIGWIDGEDIYLEPMAAHQSVQNAARNSGEDLAVTPATLRKRLNEKGLLASIDVKRQTLTIRRVLCGSSKDVLHFRRNTLLPDADEDANVGRGRRFVGYLSGEFSRPDIDKQLVIRTLDLNCRKCRVCRRGERAGNRGRLNPPSWRWSRFLLSH